MNWSDLSMSQRSELMSIYLKHGITSLDEMKKHYNSFAEGGFTSPSYPPFNNIPQRTDIYDNEKRARGKWHVENAKGNQQSVITKAFNEAKSKGLTTEQAYEYVADVAKQYGWSKEGSNIGERTIKYRALPSINSSDNNVSQQYFTSEPISEEEYQRRVTQQTIRQSQQSDTGVIYDSDEKAKRDNPNNPRTPFEPHPATPKELDVAKKGLRFLQPFDPTGITGIPDALDAVGRSISGNGNWWDLTTNVVGAIPVVGKVNKVKGAGRFTQGIIDTGPELLGAGISRISPRVGSSLQRATAGVQNITAQPAEKVMQRMLQNGKIQEADRFSDVWNLGASTINWGRFGEDFYDLYTEDPLIQKIKKGFQFAEGGSIDDPPSSRFTFNYKPLAWSNYVNTGLNRYNPDLSNFYRDTFTGEKDTKYSALPKKQRKIYNTALSNLYKTEDFNTFRNTLQANNIASDWLKYQDIDNPYSKFTVNDLKGQYEYNLYQAYQNQLLEEAKNKYPTAYTEGSREAINAANFIDNYYNSKGYQQRASRYGISTSNPLPSNITVNIEDFDNNKPSRYLFRLDDVGSHASFIDEGNDIKLWNNIETVASPLGVAAHEYAHLNPLYNTRTTNKVKTVDSPYYGMDYSSVPQRYKDILIGKGYTDNHDKELNENYSDLLGLRAELQKAGIFNSFDGSIFDENLLQKVKDSGIKNRFLEYHTDQQIIDALNEVADAGQSNIDNYAAEGGKLDRPPERFFGVATPEVTDNNIYYSRNSLLPEVNVTAKGDPRKVNNDYYRAHSRARADLQYKVQTAPGWQLATLGATLPAAFILAPTVLPAVGKVLTNPLVDAALTTHGAITAPKNIVEGVNEIKAGNYGKGALDLGLTALDVAGGFGLIKNGIKYVNTASPKLAEVLLSTGDALMLKPKQTIKNVIKNKKALNYIFNPRADKNLVYNLGPGFGYNGTAAYSGPIVFNGSKGVEIVDSGRGRYPGDVIDLFLGKNLDKAPFPLTENYPKGISNYTKSRYGIENPRVYDMGIVDNEANRLQRESSWIFKNGTPVLDPGGHKTYKVDDIGTHHYDIWKYNPDDFMRKWAKKDWSWPKKIAARAATSFIDKQGEPIAHIWTQPYGTGLVNDSPTLSSPLLKDLGITDMDLQYILKSPPSNINGIDGYGWNSDGETFGSEINFEEIKFGPNFAEGGPIHIKPEKTKINYSSNKI